MSATTSFHQAGFQGLPRSYWLLIFGMFVNRLGAFVLPFLSIYLRESEGFREVEVAGILVAWGIGCVIAGIVGGQLTDRWGRRATMIFSLCGGSLSLIALVYIHDALWFAVLALVFGAVAELYRPAVAACISDLTTPEQRARAFGHLMWAYNLGFSISPIVAGWFAERWGFAWLFFGDAATMLFAAMLLAALLPETRPAAAAAAQSTPYRAMDALKDRRFRPLLLAIFAVGLIMIQFATSLGPLMRSDGISLGQYGWIAAVNGFLIVLIQPWLIPHVEAWGRYRILPWSALAFGIGFTIHAFVQSAPAHIGALACWTLGEVVLFPLCFATVSDLAPESMRGRYQGLYWMAWSVSAVLGPPMGIYLLDIGGQLAWGGAMSALGVFAAAALVVMARRIREDREATPTVSLAAKTSIIA